MRQGCCWEVVEFWMGQGYLVVSDWALELWKKKNRGLDFAIFFFFGFGFEKKKKIEREVVIF